MMWYRRVGAGLLIRASGLVLLGIAGVAGTMLYRSVARHVGADPGAGEWLLALIAFAAASPGSALLIVGPMLFEPVEISARWRRRCVIQHPVAPRSAEPWPAAHAAGADRRSRSGGRAAA